MAQLLGVPRLYPSYDALLADPDIDAVYIPLPNQLHFEWSVRALEAGKHVLCEKPLCLSVDQVSQLCRVRDRSGMHIEEGFGFRNHPQWQKLDELLAADAIGAVRSVHATLAKQFHDPADIRNKPAAGGGALFDLGSYAISACNLIFKRQPRRVVAALEVDPRFGIDRLCSALLDYGDRHAQFTVALVQTTAVLCRDRATPLCNATANLGRNARGLGCRVRARRDHEVQVVVDHMAERQQAHAGPAGLERGPAARPRSRSSVQSARSHRRRQPRPRASRCAPPRHEWPRRRGAAPRIGPAQRRAQAPLPEATPEPP